MRKIRCYECGKLYDFDKDDFCPKCGAFNLPQRQIRVGSDGTVVRVQEPVVRKDGINERNHAGSFVHRELHQENRVRKGTPLAASAKRKAPPPPAAVKPRTGTANNSWKKKEDTGPFKYIWWTIVGVFVFRAVMSFLSRWVMILH